MLKIKKFTFNAFQENSFIVYDDESQECFIIDPGCSNPDEDKELLDYITTNELKPIKLINTHCHIDHVLGNQLIADRYNLDLEAHRLEVKVLESCGPVSKMYGIPFRGSPSITTFLDEDSSLHLNGSEIDILFAPGHSPGSICLHLKDIKQVIGGDVLFQGSIGRTDLPGGDFNTLIQSIRTKLFTLAEDVVVHPGHGPQTNIGHEKRSNPFLN